MPAGPTVLGRFGLTRELCTTVDYRRPRQWALALYLAGFDGIHYAPRHDPQGDLRAAALFGPAGSHDAAEAHLRLEGIEPVGDEALRLSARYGLYVADVPPIVHRPRGR